MNPQSTCPKPDKPPRAGLILAGGHSTRMGQDKAQLQLRGQSLLEILRARLQRLGLDPVWVSGRYPGALPDPEPGMGPLGGLAAVAAVAPLGTELLVVAVDQPRLSECLLRLLLDAPPIRALRFASEPLPMRLVLDLPTCEVLAQLLSDPDPRMRSLYALQSRLGVESLALDGAARRELLGVNTPEEWLGFLREQAI